jgi:hypothetical protein
MSEKDWTLVVGRNKLNALKQKGNCVAKLRDRRFCTGQAVSLEAGHGETTERLTAMVRNVAKVPNDGYSFLFQAV